MLREMARREARKVARTEGEEMLVVIDTNEHSGEPEYGYCPARAKHLLFPLATVFERFYPTERRA